MSNEEKLRAAIEVFLSDIGWKSGKFVSQIDHASNICEASVKLAKAIEPPFIPKKGQVVFVSQGDNSCFAKFKEMSDQRYCVEGYSWSYLNARPLNATELEGEAEK